ncbi:MutS family DNA mismatch repair protein [Pontibacter flavimaris]|uniref:DNA mismatch repair protein MutS n=1 Tax=Pontibacter flavimaris TaxID=1797110 RepID=A0A1Q5PA28_9BACT|nr:MutS family DNA mismatch repair protein [Pontibacter flavimaris]OKL39089.1 DNA mismatch repair protein MutS [Pontibacter flavimaris]
MSESRENLYLDRASAFAEQEKKAASTSSAVSWLRVGVFVAGAVLAYLIFKSGNNTVGALAILGFYSLFILVMRWHSRLDFRYQQLRLLRQVNEQEVERLQGKLSKFDGGQEFVDDHHPYTSDLDIFGHNSLFQLLNRSVTSIGKYKLALWLRKAAAPEQVLQRQEAVAELASPLRLEWLQGFLALPMHYKHDAESAAGFIHWFKDKAFFRQHGWLKPLLFILPVLTLAAIAGWFYGLSGWVAVGLLVVQYLLAHKYTVERDEYYEKSISIYEAMRSYTKQLQHIEWHQFDTPMLQELHQRLLKSGTSSSASINKLANIIDFFSYRLSTLMAFFLNATLMWDFVWMYRLESWKELHLQQLEQSLEVLAEFEALASMAAFQHAHPHFAVPRLSQTPFLYQASALAHPLIFSVKPVANDFEMQGIGHTIVITGSNMSGKTTFLRTVGINMVLALLGAPVCARSMTVAPAQVYTAMRTADNLSENTSSFYAELKRLRVLLELTELGQPVFYLLDEILKGTNSRDRHIGAMSLIRQLHKRNASGLISTHDLELGAMEQELRGSVENYSFNSDIIGNEINFDYKLTPGLCRSFNASKLMQLMGIEIEEEA